MSSPPGNARSYALIKICRRSNGRIPYSSPEVQSLLNDFAASIAFVPDLHKASSLTVSTNTTMGAELELVVAGAGDYTLAGPGNNTADGWVGTVATFLTMAIEESSPYDYSAILTDGVVNGVRLELASLSLSMPGLEV